MTMSRDPAPPPGPEPPAAGVAPRPVSEPADVPAQLGRSWTWMITTVVAYPHGPGGPARTVRTAGTVRTVRTTAERGTTATGRAPDRVGVLTGATGRWLPGHRKWTTSGVISAGALALVFWNHPSAGAVALVLCLVPAVLLLVPVLAAAAGPAAGHEDRAAAP